MLTPEEVGHIAGLARLGLSPEEIQTFGKQLSAILDYAHTLARLDTEQVAPTATVLALENVLAPDRAEPSLSQEDALANSPQVQDGQFRVTAIME